MDRRKTSIGILLIALGLIMALGNLNMVKELVILPIISVVFLFIYFYLGAWKKRGNIGFIIPGVIVGIVGIFAILEEGGYIPESMEPIFLVMLGAGFLLIMLIHTIRIEGGSWGEKYWPIFPGAILVLIGSLAVTIEEDSPVFGLITPVILIVIGVCILLRPMIKNRNK